MNHSKTGFSFSGLATPGEPEEAEEEPQPEVDEQKSRLGRTWYEWGNFKATHEEC